MNLVEVTFDQKNIESVTETIVSVYTHLDDKILPALAKAPHFQKKMVDLLNEKLQRSLRKMYTTFNMKMMEFKSEIKNIDDWISAYNYVGSSIVSDDKKASSWVSSNLNSSNSQNDKPLRDNEWHKNKTPKGSWNDNYYQQTPWVNYSYQNMRELSKTVDQNPSEVNNENVKPVRPTMAELLKKELKLLCNHCGWKVEPNSRHSRSCRYMGHPHYNHDGNTSYRASSTALAQTPALIALDMNLKYDTNTKKD